jgi:ribosomal protein L40E
MSPGGVLALSTSNERARSLDRSRVGPLDNRIHCHPLESSVIRLSWRTHGGLSAPKRVSSGEARSSVERTVRVFPQHCWSSSRHKGNYLCPPYCLSRQGSRCLNIETAPGEEEQGEPTPEEKQHRMEPCNSEPKRCRKCGATLGPEATTARFGEKPAYDVYVCGGCGFIQWIAVS